MEGGVRRAWGGREHQGQQGHQGHQTRNMNMKQEGPFLGKDHLKETFTCIAHKIQVSLN